MSPGQARRFGMMALAAVAVAGPAAAGPDPAAEAARLATACQGWSVGISRKTLSLTVEDGVLAVTESLRLSGDSAFRPTETLRLPLARARVRSAGTDTSGRPLLALTCRGEPVHCMTVTAADGAPRPATGLILLTACDKASARALEKALRRLR